MRNSSYERVCIKKIKSYKICVHYQYLYSYINAVDWWLLYYKRKTQKSLKKQIHKYDNYSK